MQHDCASAKKIYVDGKRDRRRGGVDKKGGGGYRRQGRRASDLDSDSSGRSSGSPVASRDLPSIKPVASWHVVPPVSDSQSQAGRSRRPGPQAPQRSGAAASQAAQAGASGSGTVDTGRALVSFLASAQIEPSNASYTYLVISRPTINMRVAGAFVRCDAPDVRAAATPPLYLPLALCPLTSAPPPPLFGRIFLFTGGKLSFALLRSASRARIQPRGGTRGGARRRDALVRRSGSHVIG